MKSILVHWLATSESLVAVSASQGSCELDAASLALTCDLGIINPGAKPYIQMRATNAGTPGTSIFSLTTVGTSSKDSNPANNRADSDVPIVAHRDVSDLRAALNVYPDAAHSVGGTVSFDLGFYNLGPSPGAGTVEAFVDPQHFRAVDIDASTPMACAFNPQTHIARCTAADPVPVGAYTFGRVRFTIADEGPLALTARLTQRSNLDPRGANDASSATIPLSHGMSDLGAIFTTPDPTPMEGGILSFTLGISNNGPTASPGKVRVYFDPFVWTFMENLGAYGLDCGMDPFSSVLTCTSTGSIPVGGKVTADVQVALRTGGHRSLVANVVTGGGNGEYQWNNNQVLLEVDPVGPIG